MDDITENFMTECLFKVQASIESICGIFQLESGTWMDGLNDTPTNKNKERGNTIYL